MRHPNLVEWEKKLRGIFNKIDSDLETRYGQMYPLHPSRAKHGKTGNSKHDGLFKLDAAFSAGFGSQKGPGYILKIEMITLHKVPADIRAGIEDEVAHKLREQLETVFPGRELKVERDGRIYKLFGDLSLGEL
jgi:hypothetical protein